MTPIQPQLTPCPHMVRALEAMAQGKNGGIYIWYAKLHTLKCNRCRAALDSLKNYFSQIHSPISNVDINLEKLRDNLRAADRES